MKTVIDKFLKLHHLSQEEYVELLQCWEKEEIAKRLAEEAVRLLLKRIDQNRNGTDKEDGQYEHEILVLPAKIAEGKSIARCG